MRSVDPSPEMHLTSKKGRTVNLHVNIFKIYTVCVYVYMHNKYTQYTHILCQQKLTNIFKHVRNQYTDSVFDY